MTWAWVDGAELQKGDRICAGEYQNVGNPNTSAPVVDDRKVQEIVTINVRTNGKREFWTIDSKGNKHFWGLLDEYRWYALRQETARRQVSSGLWNGRCGRCGMGTYTGFLSTEHEGGACA